MENKFSLQLLCHHIFISTSDILPLQMAYKFCSVINKCYHIYKKKERNKQVNKEKEKRKNRYTSVRRPALSTCVT